MAKIKSVPKIGDMGADVKTLQQALIAKGIKPRGGADGVFGSGTLEAVIKFQAKNKLKPTKPGNLGPKTLALLGLEVVAVNPVTNEKTITQDLVGKLDRHLHPSIRVQLEMHLFPGGIIPKCFKDADIQKCHIAANEALEKLKIVETGGNNRGEKVGQVQGTVGKFTKGGNGEAWCLDFQQIPIAIIEDYFKIESPVPATAHCVTCFNGAKKIAGLTTTEFEIGTLALGQRKPSTNGHAMGVIKELSATTMMTCEGNTSIKSMTDGDGSGFKTRNKKKNGDLVTLGYVRVYPNNKLPKGK